MKSYQEIITANQEQKIIWINSILDMVKEQGGEQHVEYLIETTEKFMAMGIIGKINANRI